MSNSHGNPNGLNYNPSGKNQFPKDNQGLTVKERKYVKKLIEIGNGTEAVAQVYDVKKRITAARMSKMIKQKPHVQRAIQDALKRKGLTTDQLAENIAFLANTRPDKISADVVLRSNIEVLKLQGAYDKMNKTQSFKAIITKLPNKTLIMELEKRSKSSGNLISEINANKSL